MRPEELTEIGDSEKQETDKNMEEMWTVLKAQEGHRWAGYSCIISSSQ